MLQPQTSTRVTIIGLKTSSSCRLPMLDTVREDRFDAHLATLPSLGDLVRRAEAANPDFKEHLRGAKEKRYKELLAEVRAGRLSRITAERLRLGMTQVELATRSGIAQPNISRLEKPGAPVSVSTARRLAEALGIDDYKELLP